MLKSILIGALGVFAANAVAVPAELVERDACNADNLYRCFINTKSTAAASAFCSDLMPFTTTVATTTSIRTSTAWVTLTVATETDTVSSTTTVFTATVPSATVSVNGGQPVFTVVPRDGTEAKPKAKRCAAAPEPPHCMTNGVTYPASRITSACSCISVAASTVSITFTVADEATVTSTSSVTATASTTAWATVSTVKTSGVSTVTVPPPATES